MGTHTTTAGKVKVGFALEPHAYELLKHMASGPRAIGALLDDLILAEAARSAAGQPEQPADPASAQPQRQGERAQILHEIDRAILAAQSPRDIAQVAAEAVLRAVDAARVSVSLWQPTDDRLEILAWAGLPHPDLRVGSSIIIQPWAWLAQARRGQPAFSTDLERQPDPTPEGQLAFAQGIRSHTAIPLMLKGEPIGHLDIQRRVAGGLDDEDLALAGQVADSLAVAIHNARLLEGEQQARQRLETLQAANAALTQSLDLDTVLDALLSFLGKLVPYDTANVMLRTSDTQVTVRAAAGYERWTDPTVTRRLTFDAQSNPLIRDLFANQQSVLVPDTTQFPGWERVPGAEHVLSWLVVPLVLGGRVLGLFSVDKAEAGFFRTEHVRLAEALAPQAAVAIQNAQLYTAVKTGRHQLQALSRRLVELQERERRALSRDLHDTSGQTITALKLGLASLRREEEHSEAVCAYIDELVQLADTVSEDLHRLAVNLRPSSLDRYGLVPALEQLLTEFRKQTGLKVEFLAHGMGDDRLPADTETALYRIVQEATTNCARYAHARGLAVMVQHNADSVQVIVEDDGQGFDVEEAVQRGRLGLLGMRERAEMLGGTLDIESSPGSGTVIYVTVPTRRADGSEFEPAEAPEAVSLTPALEGHLVESNERLAEAAELARAKALSDTLVEIATGMTDPAHTQNLLAFMLTRSAEAIDCNFAAVLFREGDGWVIGDGYGLRPSMSGQRLTDEDVPDAVKIEQTGEMVVQDDIRGGEAIGVPLNTWGVRSVASIPLVAGGRFLGIAAYAHESAAMPFKPSEVQFLKRLAGLVSLAMENVQLREVEARQRDELVQRVGELETLLELLPVGVAIATDPEGRVIHANPANARMLGEPPQANVSLNTGELPREASYRVYQDGRALRPEELPMQRAVGGQTVRDMVIDLVRGDGTSVTLLSSAVPLVDANGKPRGAVGAFSDVTELRRAQARAETAHRAQEMLARQLEKAREDEIRQRVLFEAVLAAVPVGLAVIAGHDFEIKLANGAYRAITPHPEVDPVGRHYTEIWPREEGFDRGESWLASVIETGQALEVPHHMRVFPDGSQHHFAFHVRHLSWGDESAALVVLVDTTTVERSAANARALAAELDVILSGIADGLVVYDVAGRILRMNPVAAEMLGYNAETQGVTIEERSATVVRPRKPDGSSFSPEEFPAVRALHGEVVRNQEMVLSVPARVGGELRVSVTSAPIRAQDGTVTGCVTTFSDMEAYHQAIEQLRRANAELEAVLAAIPDGLIVYDEAGRVRRINDLALEMLGYREETWRRRVDERVGTTIQAFWADGTPCERDEYAIVRALRGEAVHNLDQYIHLPHRPEKDFWGLFSAGPIWGTAGSQTGAVITITNVSRLHEVTEQLSRREALLEAQAGELREAAERLDQRVRERTADLVAANQELAEAYRAAAQREAALEYQAVLLANVRDAIIGTDADLRLTTWGGAADELYGWRAEEVIGRHLTQATCAQLSIEERAALMRTLTETGHWRGETVHLRRDGTPFWVEANIVALRDSTGAITGYVTVNRDTTERKAAEAAIGVQNEHLEILREIDRSILAARAPVEIARAALEKLRQATGALRVAVSLFDFATDVGEVLAVAGADSARIPVGSQWSISTGWMIDQVVAGHIASVADVGGLPDGDAYRALRLAEGIRAATMIPMMVGRQVIGQLTVYRAERGLLPPTVTDLAAHVADSLAVAIQNARLNEELRYQAMLLENVSDAIVAYDADLRITAWNHAAEALYGRTAVEALGARLPEVVGSQMGEEDRVAALQAARDDGRWQGEIEHTRQDGCPIIVESTAMALRDAQGQIFAHVAVNRDITARKQAEDELRASREQLKALSRRLVDIQEQERGYVADQLYNEAGQVLAALKLHLKTHAVGSEAAPLLAETQQLLDRVMSDLHHLATDLRPATLDQLGLVSAVRQYAEEWGREHALPVQVGSFHTAGMRIAKDAETAVYRVIQEALTNVGRHAAASTVTISMTRTGGKLVVVVEDDGSGFDPVSAMAQGAMGLLAMRERVESVGGRFDVESAPRNGTGVFVEIPLNPS